MQRELLTNGNYFKRSDGRWGGTVWYRNEKGERKRKTFSGTNKGAVNKKIKHFIEHFNDELKQTDETVKTLRASLKNWLVVFKFTSVEQTSYDRCEQIAEKQIYPIIGDELVGDITTADIKKLMNYWMNKGYSYSTVKKVYTLLNEYFRYQYQQDAIPKNPMDKLEMIKKANFLSTQGKEDLPEREKITIFSDEEIERFRKEALSVYSNDKRKYQQAAAYILMLNTGMRTGEVLGLLNSDINLEKRSLYIQRGVKEIQKRKGAEATSGRDIKVGKPKTKTSKREIPLNDVAIEMIQDLRNERYFGEDAPLIPDENGGFTKPINFRKRFYRILKAAGIEQKGLHSLRHTFATNLVNGRKDENGEIHTVPIRTVADILGHTTTEITELYYVKRDMGNLNGATDAFKF